ncbi:hypothetical protein [Neobacillus mesonae]|uniref:hypothetical protein n=1 Tax=Neobacillus mesonae TaxID=1193713 RepID=UPI00203B1551|nr:hypothetical protein [Neobacillus mesonae]MCM3567203.1 hypothetical protein [Neobacillus mesonae]
MSWITRKAGKIVLAVHAGELDYPKSRENRFGGPCRRADCPKGGENPFGGPCRQLDCPKSVKNRFAGPCR